LRHIVLTAFALTTFIVPGCRSARALESVPTVVIQGGTLLDVHTGHEVANSLIVVEGDGFDYNRAQAPMVPDPKQAISETRRCLKTSRFGW